ncbi:MAG: type VI secretion system-associated FHA domain protein [Myxococcales bacterium]
MAVPMILEVRVKAPPGGTSRTLYFAASPIRVGRNQLNDICLEDPFVSEWHGTIRFDDCSVAYFDLGSTNGTLLDKKRLAKNVATELSETSCLRLGLLELTACRQAPGAVARPQQVKASGPNLTLGWGMANAASGPDGDPINGPGRRAPLNTAGSTAGRADPGPASSAGSDAPLTPAYTEVTGELMARQSTLLEAFAKAFIGLRKGYEQFGAEVGVRTINGSTPLHRAHNQAELLEYMLRRNADSATMARDLIAIFADFGIHHVAMMEGVTESVRAMLASLNPPANNFDMGRRLFSGPKAKEHWNAYLERFDQMITDDNELHAAIFGSEFARAYASVTMGDGAKRSDKDPR